LGIGRVLLVEDCLETQVLVRAALHQHAALTCVTTIQAALQHLQNEKVDLVLLDLALPDGDGFYLCAEMKAIAKTETIPVFFLTSRGTAHDKVMGFSMGCDDYILKPFDPLELRARVSAKLKKVLTLQQIESTFQKGLFRLDSGAQRACIARGKVEEELSLSSREFRLLFHLVRNEGRVLSRSQLLDSVWGSDVNVSDRVVDTHICNLRKKISTDFNHIPCVFGQGYRFLAHSVVKNSYQDLSWILTSPC